MHGNRHVCTRHLCRHARSHICIGLHIATGMSTIHRDVCTDTREDMSVRMCIRICTCVHSYAAPRNVTGSNISSSLIHPASQLLNDRSILVITFACKAPSSDGASAQNVSRYNILSIIAASAQHFSYYLRMQGTVLGVQEDVEAFEITVLHLYPCLCP